MTNPPHHGGNKIPDRYLKRFLPSQGQETHDDLPYELRIFINQMGNSKKELTNGNDYEF